ncbi:GAF domain-containing protein [Aetokthonos hydrillicola Thurmond2011]|jgi:light-regulated signal transduction histidine kinase (bacteriophytochrome)|uniref:GAF domain-containing protein n=1 Tax=Aetokthonos hydrillicola Thurmond2011 TaxID=2712845 RepID=A0AAP5IDR8_9CYAN|nr:GAF domain-containing protein [Aetokthonos hydrillicola]MBO3457716.1 GAF domain-containing protein [Aetokthonos hydrillicola CCALA 1050]MBW4589433.1 GAF domain-containing protein [Aetokthonos hydrillicola CCALA 1050]MDR9897090.1 GAF domain-containing protein [Aetokthonos hydrillicola Thurmond2011]
MNPLENEEIQIGVDSEKLVLRIKNYILQKLELPEILSLTVNELRSFLGTDRIKIYKFHPDASGQVIAESIKDNRLPSLLGLNFPADDIPPHARELFIKSRVRSVVNVDTQEIGQSAVLELENGDLISEEIRYRPVDPCHVEYLTAMGVYSSVVVPIFHHKDLWGLLVSHNSEPLVLSEEKLELMQRVANDLAMGISRHAFITQGRERAKKENILNHINTLLHSSSTIELQPALEETVAVFNGSGGRLYIRDNVFNFDTSSVINSVAHSTNSSNYYNIYTCGNQPVIPETARYPLMEQYCVWQDHYKSSEYDVWAISDIYQIPELRTLQVAFKPTQIRGILIIPLQYRHQMLGYLSVFRDEAEKATLWAGEFDPDQRQLYPRQSFEIWQQSKKAQAQDWTREEIELAQQLGKQFALAIHEYKLTQQIDLLKNNLNTQPQESVETAQQITQQQQILLEMVTTMAQSVEVDAIFTNITRKLRQFLHADRVVIYRFKPNTDLAEGEIVAEDVLADFVGAFSLQIQDNCFQKTNITQYRQGRVRTIPDIYNAGLSDCYLEMLARLQVRAILVVPIVKDNDLWGLLCIHQCSQARNWKTSEIQFALLVGNLLSLAVQKTDAIAQMQSQAVDLRAVTAQKQVLFDILSKIGQSMNSSVPLNTNNFPNH